MSRARPLLADAATRLAQAGVPSPEYDARALLAHVVGCPPGELALADVGQDAQVAFAELITRRVSREPLQHLLGSAAFRHVEVDVGPGVFVPRPETELLAGWAVEQAAARERPVVVDLCTGSGVIARSIAVEVPDASVHAVELDPGAVAWAERNLTGTGVDLHEGDLATSLRELDGRVDVVTANPPYVPWEAWESVAPEARDHDPHLALFSGEDGLDTIRSVEVRAASLLRPGGVVGVEHAEVQARSAPGVFLDSGRWSDVRDHLDLAGRPRFLTARLAR